MERKQKVVEESCLHGFDAGASLDIRLPHAAVNRPGCETGVFRVVLTDKLASGLKQNKTNEKYLYIMHV